jgi:co-chaperonin GroES (HSP10)
MQSTYRLSIDNIHPYKGQILCEPLTGEYQTESGITVVASFKKNPKIEKLRVLKLGLPFMAREFYLVSKKIKKEWPGTYWAKPGDIIWHFRASEKKQDIQGKTHAFVYNENIRAVWDGVKLKTVSNHVLIKPIYEETAHGSFLLVQDRDRKTTANFYGIVMHIGPESKHRFHLEEGQKVLFRRTYGVGAEGTALVHDGVEYLALSDRWVEANIED